MIYQKCRAKFVMAEKNLSGKDALNLSTLLCNMSTGQWTRMYLDCARVNDVDATGLAVLIRLYSQLSNQGKQLVLIGIHENIKHLFAQHGLLKIFDCLPDRENQPPLAQQAFKPASLDGWHKPKEKDRQISSVPNG